MLVDQLIASPPHAGELFRELSIRGKVDQLVWVSFQVMEKFKRRILLNVTGVDPAGTADTLVLGNTARHMHQMFTEKVAAPVVGLFASQQGPQTVALIGLRHLDACQLNNRRWNIDIQSNLVEHHTALILRSTRIVNHEWHSQRFLVMRPLAGKTTLAEVITVVSRVNDDRVV